MGSRMTIETQIMTIENANTNLQTLNAMKQGASALSNIHGKMLVLIFIIIYKLLFKYIY